MQSLMGRTTEQRREALVNANVVRTGRAALKRQVHEGGLPPDYLIGPAARHDTRLRTMKVVDALKHTPQIGEVRAQNILAQARMSPVRTMGGLTDSQWQRMYAAAMASKALQARCEAWRARH